MNRTHIRTAVIVAIVRFVRMSPSLRQALVVVSNHFPRMKQRLKRAAASATALPRETATTGEQDEPLLSPHAARVMRDLRRERSRLQYKRERQGQR